MKNVWMLAGAAALLAACSTSVAQACETGKTSLSSLNQSRRKTLQRRIPLSVFKTQPAATAADTTPPASSSEPPVTGLWTTGMVDGDMVIDLGFEVFSNGGTHLLLDPSPILEGNVCAGAWTQTAPYTYLINHPAYLYDDQGVNVVGMAYIYEKVILDPSGNTFSEHFKVLIEDLDGKLLDMVEGDSLGKRIQGNDNPLK